MVYQKKKLKLIHESTQNQRIDQMHLISEEQENLYEEEDEPDEKKL